MTPKNLDEEICTIEEEIEDDLQFAMEIHENKVNNKRIQSEMGIICSIQSLTRSVILLNRVMWENRNMLDEVASELEQIRQRI